MEDLSPEEFEKKTLRDAVIIALVGLILFMALVLYGFKIISGL